MSVRRRAVRRGGFVATALAALPLLVAAVPTTADPAGGPVAGSVATPSAVGPATMSLSAPVAKAPGPVATAVPADTILSRADSARLRVLERLRTPPTGTGPGAAADTLPDLPELPDPDLPADTVVADPEAVDRQVEDTVAVPGARPGAPARDRRPTPPTELPAGADSIMRALAQLPGYSVAAYRGTEADFEAAERRLVLRGSPDDRALFSGQGNRVEADSTITFDDRTGRVRTTGPTLFSPQEGDPVESSALIFDLEGRRGTAPAARTTFTEAATWFVRGDLDSVEEGRLFGSRARFTSCDHDPPHSFFEASQVKIVANQVLVARGVRMYVEDVPVLWLPFLAQNLGSGRASGLLTPAFSLNDVVRTSSGYNRRISNIGYYWAMSEYSDATLALDWFSNNYLALTGGVRYRWRSQFLDGNVNLRRFWRETGQQEFGLDTRHNWEISERTRANVSGRFITSSEFVNQNSFDPQELTQTINSEAGFSHRFSWGNLSVSANRRQHLSDDRVDMNLPTASLNVNTMTLFPAPVQSASWYNNLTLGGGMRVSRDVYERPFQPDTAFVLNRADEVRTRARANASAGLGDFSLSGSVDFSETLFADVPMGLFERTPGDEATASMRRFGGFTTGDGLPPALDPFLQSDFMGDPRGLFDVESAQINWNTSLSYRLNLIGSTTFSPNVSISGETLRHDTIPDAMSFVSGPNRISAGARLQTDIYGFYRGIGGFDAIRHKVTPAITYSYSPEVTPSELQRQVFGARAARPRKILTVGFNQTWEARVSEMEEERAPRREDPPVEDPAVEPDDPDEVVPGVPSPDDPDVVMDPDDPLAEPEDPQDVPTILPGEGDPEDGPRRAPRAQIVNLLALNTTAITYDLVEADSTGRFIDGFTTTRLSNTVRSDYLRGLDLSFEHDLFEDPGRVGGENGEGAGPGRRFAPHLSRVNLGFQLNQDSRVIQTLNRWFGVGPDEDPGHDDHDHDHDHDEDRGPSPEEEDDWDGPPPGTGPDGFDQNRIVPDRDGARGATRGEGWNARMRYSLNRPREGGPGAGMGRNEQLQWDLSFAPSPNWAATWRSAYNLTENRFADHDVRLIRDLHEWEASFGFRQTVRGNWSFTFEVALRANRDLSFDYQQRDSAGAGRGLR